MDSAMACSMLLLFFRLSVFFSFVRLSEFAGRWVWVLLRWLPRKGYEHVGDSWYCFSLWSVWLVRHMEGNKVTMLGVGVCRLVFP